MMGVLGKGTAQCQGPGTGLYPANSGAARKPGEAGAETQETATESSQHLSSLRGFRTLKDFDFLAMNETAAGMLCATG